MVYKANSNSGVYDNYLKKQTPVFIYLQVYYTCPWIADFAPNMSLVPEKPTMDAKHVEDPEMNHKGGHVGTAGDYSGAVAKVDPKEIALVRKLDLRIMPTLWCMYFMNYVRIRTAQLEVHRLIRYIQLDRNAIANARLNGLEDSLGLVKTQYNTCISILFVG